jgi:hypothetical protein
VQEDKRTTQEGEPQKEHQVPEPPLVTRSISNTERGRPLERTPSLKEPSPTTTTCFKIKIAYAHYIAIDTLCLKMCAKLKEHGLQCPLFLLSCWHIDEKTCPFANVNIQKPPYLKGETCPLGTNRNKNHPSLELQLLPQSHKKK